MTLVSRLALAAALFLFPASGFAGGVARPVVVELYTSQGCSSCPPADALLGKLAQRPDVIAISLPITYWDMLGWKDTLASDANTRRQKAYAAAMGHGGVYTPQLIVDGAIDVVGSRAAGVEAAILARRQNIEAARNIDFVAAGYNAAGAARPDPVVPVTVTENPQEMHIAIGTADWASVQNATVWMFHLRSAVNVDIGAGENEGRTMTYHNVVGDLRAVGVWKGERLTLTLPRAAMQGLPHDGVAIVVQQGGYGHVLGAAYLSRPDYAPL